MLSKFFIIGIFIILVCPLIIAELGLSSDYHNENPIRVDLGDVKEIIIGRFINTDNEDINLNIELVEGFEIAELLDEKIRVLANSKEKLRIKISVPNNASRGDSFNIGIKYTEVSSEEEGMVVIASSNTISVPVVVEKLAEVKKEASKKNIIWIMIILGILVIIILVVVIKFILKEKPAFSEPVGEF